MVAKPLLVTMVPLALSMMVSKDRLGQKVIRVTQEQLGQMVMMAPIAQSFRDHDAGVTRIICDDGTEGVIRRRRRW